jgi:hypothetical protein
MSGWERVEREQELALRQSVEHLTGGGRTCQSTPRSCTS